MPRPENNSIPMRSGAGRYHRRSAAGTLLAVLLTALLVSGCGVSGRLGKQLDGTVGDILFSQHERVSVTLNGGERLNPDAEGNSLSVVVRVYQLDSLNAFSTASAAELWQGAGDILGDALLSEREIIVLPGGQTRDSAPMAQQVSYVAVVAFFRQMPDERWRLVFDAAAMRKDGILTSSGGIALNLVDSHIEPAGEGSAKLLAADNQRPVFGRHE